MLLFIALTVFFLAASLPLVLAPLRRQGVTSATNTGAAVTAGAGEYEARLLALRDLEFDHELGLIAGDDYARLREKLMVEAASALESAGREKGEEVAARIEAAVRAMRRQSPQPEGAKGVTRFCPQCGSRVDPGDRFCTACGAAQT